MDVSDINDIKSQCEGLHVKQHVEVFIKWRIFDLSLLRDPVMTTVRSSNFTVRDGAWSLGIASHVIIDGKMGFFVELFRHRSETKSDEIEYQIEIQINNKSFASSGKKKSIFEKNKVFHFFDLSQLKINTVYSFSVLCTFYLAKIPEEPYEIISNDAVTHEPDSKQNTRGTCGAHVQKKDHISCIRINRCPHGRLRMMKNLLVCIEWKKEDLRNFFRNTRGIASRIQTLQMKDATWILEVSNDEEKKTVCVQLSTDRSEMKYEQLVYQIAVDFSGNVLRTAKKIFPVDRYKALESFVIPESICYRLYSSYSSHNVCGTVSCTIYVNIPTEPSKEVDASTHRKYSSDSNTGIDILSSHMKDLFLEGDDSDFIINVKDKEFKVHKAILSSRSPVLYEMLHCDTARNNGEIDIVDCEPDVFQHFLLYLYTGQVGELSWENVMQLYGLGHKYDLQHLGTECVEFMECNMHIDTFCDAVALAARYNLPSLIKRAEEFFVKNVDKIVLTPKWMVLVKKNPVACNELFIKLTTSKSK